MTDDTQGTRETNRKEWRPLPIPIEPQLNPGGGPGHCTVCGTELQGNALYQLQEDGWGAAVFSCDNMGASKSTTPKLSQKTRR